MLEWHTKTFTQLTPDEFYRVMRLRQEVFVVEQKCPFVDADGKDQKSLHLMGYKDAELAAYGRIVAPGVSYPEVSLGRISTPLQYRRFGYGRQLMQQLLNKTTSVYGPVAIRIEAQLYLKKFYEDFGFVPQSEPYILDDILHVEMLRNA
ncbi:MAG TPA: GNAT family N-acetyltransferase [Chitinophagales bacterium]|nr:GNAT family N-acetyltransferase [Chitinophagales bacterium]